MFCSITPTNLGELSKPGTVSESAHPEDSKTVTGSYIWPRFGWENQGKRQQINSKIMFEIRICLIPWITQAHLSQIQLPGLVLEFSGRVDFETIPGFDNWPRFAGVIEQNKVPVHKKC